MLKITLTVTHWKDQRSASIKILKNFDRINIADIVHSSKCFFKEKIKINKINISSNILIILFLFVPLLIWMILFPQSRYGYFSYISFIIFYISFNFLNVGKFNRRLVVGFFSILLIFLVGKNISRIKNEISNNVYNDDNYPIKRFRSDNYSEKYINNIKFNVPLNSFMECSNIPMLCMSNINMVYKVKK